MSGPPMIVLTALFWNPFPWVEIAMRGHFDILGTDLENRAILDREGRATRGDRARFEEIGACGHAARHAIKRVE
jgi:hypothetical protein